MNRPSLLLTTTTTLLGALIAVGCPSEVPNPGECGGVVCEEEKPAEPPRLFVDPPFGLGYDCVTLGCDTERRLVVENRGGGKVRLVLTRLSSSTSTDFSIRRGDNAVLPFDDATAVDVLPGAPLELFVRYVPSDGTADGGNVVLSWHDGTKPYEDAVLTTSELPLSTRALGDVVAVADVQRINFGFVPVGGHTSRTISVTNTGNGVMALGPVSLEDLTSPVFQPPTETAWDVQFINPGETGSVDVTFRPDVVGTFSGALQVQTNDGAQPSLRVEVVGTAVGDPDAVVTTPGIDFLAIRIGTARTLPLVVTNSGGAPLTLQPAITAGTDLVLSPAEPVVVAPLESITFQLTWSPTLGGPMTGTVSFVTNDPAKPTVDVPVGGFSNAPALTSTPTEVDFGQVVQGWQTGAQTFFLTNTGFGDLSINSITFDAAQSSGQIRFVGLPQLPLKLAPGAPPVEVSVALDATTLGSVQAVVRIATDSVDNGLSVTGITSLFVRATVVSCEVGCPIPNGAPSCSANACLVGTCNNTFHDANDVPGDGCECGEDLIPAGGGLRRDVPGTCGGADIGPIGDNCANVREVRRSGSLHDESDVDMYFFRATDESRAFGCDFTGDSWGVLARLEGAPAGMRVCARRAEAGCGGEDQRTCGTTEVRFDGGNNPFGGSDTSDITVWVEWTPGSAPQCGEYTLFAKGNTND